MYMHTQQYNGTIVTLWDIIIIFIYYTYTIMWYDTLSHWKLFNWLNYIVAIARRISLKYLLNFSIMKKKIKCPRLTKFSGN